MLDAARSAPTSGNIQSWKFVVVVNKDTIKKMADAALQQVWMETAPCIIVVCSEVNRQARHYGIRGENLYAIQETAAATQNMILVANEQELATCWVASFEEQEVKRFLNMPDNVRPMVLLTLGYPDEKVPIPPKHRLSETVYFESYGNKLRMESLWPLGKHLAKGKQVLKVYTQKIVDVIKEKLPEREEKPTPPKEKKEEKKKKEKSGIPTTDDLKKLLGK